MLKQLGSELASVKVQLAETYLTNMHPDWYLYENEMAGLIKQHPLLLLTLINSTTLQSTDTMKRLC